MTAVEERSCRPSNVYLYDILLHPPAKDAVIVLSGCVLFVLLRDVCYTTGCLQPEIVKALVFSDAQRNFRFVGFRDDGGGLWPWTLFDTAKTIFGPSPLSLQPLRLCLVAKRGTRQDGVGRRGKL